MYNSGVVFQQQHKYSLAEQKYNQVLKIQPNFVEAKKNLAIIYYNYANNDYINGNYEGAIIKAKKAIDYSSKNIESYDILAKSYAELNHYEQAVSAYNKIISFNPEDENALHSIAMIYIKTKQYNNALGLYQKLLQINPSDNVATQNLKYIKFQMAEKSMNASIDSINNSDFGHNAPRALYSLIKPSAGITADSVEKMKKVLDLVWSDPSGRIILQTLISKRVPINITQGAMSANATSSRKQNTLLLYGFIPILSFSTYSGAVNIPVNYISDFYNPQLTSYQRIYSLQVFIHEFGHAFISIKNPNNVNSLEEELGVSMIGYNVATKVITGEYLSEEQTKAYSRSILIALLSDDHRTLQVKSHFNQIVQSYGVVMPYPQVYSNIRMIYRELLSEGKVSPCSSF